MAIMDRKNIMYSWQIMIPEEYGVETYIIRTSPVVLGSSTQCDIVINDQSIAEFHIQFVLINNGKSIEIYNLTAQSSGESTFLDKKTFKKKTIKAKKNNEVTLKAGDVHLLLKFDSVKKNDSHKESLAIKNKNIDLEWFYFNNGAEKGPVSMGYLFKIAQKGLLLPTDDVWNPEIDFRAKASEIPSLFNGVRSSPLKKVSRRGGLGPNICPYCWHRFQAEDMLFIARHPELMGDPVLGSEEQQRFIPRHFKPVRKAVDANGEICPDMACPRCHLRIPIPFLDSSPLFFSIIGTPGCGKSYYLASSTWRLRRVLPKFFGLNFEDVDNVTNQWLNDYEERLFFPVKGVDYQSIEKTQIEASNISRQVKINEINMFLPLPCIFTLISNEQDNSFKKTNRTLAFYDNAGEHFQTGQDVIQKPGTLHILRAQGLLFMFDPTADPRFDKVIDSSMQDKVLKTSYQQQKILTETIDRIRKNIGLNVTERFDKPVVIGLSKADLLTDYLKQKQINLKTSPFVWLKKKKLAALNLSRVNDVSDQIRALFYELAPEFVNTIESFAETVVYLPVSPIGHQPDIKGVNPHDINPLWVEIPFIFMLSKIGLIPSIINRNTDDLSETLKIKKHSVSFKSPGKSTLIEVPLSYSGKDLICPETGKSFCVPDIDPKN